MTPDTSGPTSLEPLAHYDPASSCWRMSGGMFPSDSMPSLATFPPSGMTRGGALYELPTPVPPTDEPASSSSLLPSLSANDTTGAEPREQRGARGAGGAMLCDLPTLLPTPLASDGEKGGPTPRGGSGDLRLSSAVQLLPTPAVNDMGAGKTVEDWDAWTARMQERHGNGNGHGASLSIEALRLLPTPTTQDAANTGGPSQSERNTVPLNALFGGEPTSPRSADGKPSSDDPHLTPPNPDATDDPGWLPLSWNG